MTDKENVDVLFEYLRSILFDAEPGTLDLEHLDSSFQELGEGMQFLAKCMCEMKNYALNLAKGNLSIELPARDNPLCDNLKSIHSNLNHLTWQARQIANGDYSQHVAYLGDFSAAFNRMTEQLKEREKNILEASEVIERKAELAYIDEATGLHNRRYLYEAANKLLIGGELFTLCYLDVDGLKQVNDNHGHAAGDRYLKAVISAVQEQIREKDIMARIGGDEFAVVFVGETGQWALKLLEHTYNQLHRELIKLEQDCSGFSYGVLEVAPGSGLTVDQILNRADKAMYDCKQRHKKNSGELS